MQRRDFLNGMALAIVAGMSPLQLLKAESASNLNNEYPPLNGWDYVEALMRAMSLHIFYAMVKYLS